MAMNIGTTERVLRMFVGVGLVSPVGCVGMMAFITGLVGDCRVYRILGRQS